MPIYDPYSTKSFRQQMSTQFRLDDDLDDAGKARVRKARIQFAVLVLAVVFLFIALSGEWVALAGIACFAIPIGVYFAWVYTAPKDPPATDR